MQIKKVEKMFKKMIVSMIVMSGIILATLFFLISGPTFGKPQEEVELSYRFVDENYPFFLTNEQIEDAINRGIESLKSIDSYLLPEEECSLLNKDDILFSYIEPPSLVAANIARNIHHLYGRKVRTAEVKEKLMDEYLPFVTRFNANRGYIYDIHFVQGEEKIAPYKTEIKSNGGVVVSYFRVEDINFEQAGKLHIQDVVNKTSERVYLVDFSLYDENS